MKVKALIDCKGIGYNLKKDDEGELPDKLGHKLIKFGYVQEIKERLIVPAKVVERPVQEVKAVQRRAMGARKKK